MRYTLLLFALLLPHHIAIFSMNTYQYVSPTNQCITAATHYYITPEHTTETRSNTRVIPIIHGPVATFYTYNPTTDESFSLYQQNLSSHDDLPQNIRELDARISINAQRALLPSIVKAVIISRINENRTITFYDKIGKEVKIYKQYDGENTISYDGSSDIKAEKNNLSLPKPHTIFNSLEIVEEIKPDPSQYWTTALWTYYIKEIRKYNKDFTQTVQAVPLEE